MSFDRIDKEFKRRPKLIALECVDCGTTEMVEKRVPGPHVAFTGDIGSEDDPNRPTALCLNCADKRNQPPAHKPESELGAGDIDCYCC